MNGKSVAMERSDEGRTNYLYDFLNQLVEAKFPDKDFQRFDYDPVGNRMKLEEARGITTYSYDPANEIQASVESHGGALVNTAYTCSGHKSISVFLGGVSSLIRSKTVLF